MKIINNKCHIPLLSSLVWASGKATQLLEVHQFCNTIFVMFSRSWLCHPKNQPLVARSSIMSYHIVVMALGGLEGGLQHIAVALQEKIHLWWQGAASCLGFQEKHEKTVNVNIIMVAASKKMQWQAA